MPIVNTKNILFLDLEPLNSDPDHKQIREIGIVIDDFHQKQNSAGKQAHCV